MMTLFKFYIVQSWVAMGTLKVIQLALTMGIRIPDEDVDGDEYTKRRSYGISPRRSRFMIESKGRSRVSSPQVLRVLG